MSTDSTEAEPPVLILGGPTAAGKTSLAVEIACRWGASLVSADAMLVYRGMNIGTAKPPSFVLRRYPHAAVDVRDPDGDWSVADFVAAVHEARTRSERVLVVGGTPFYLSALISPLAPLPTGDSELRGQLEALPDLHARLAEVDPTTAARLHPNDRVRLVRALEVHALTGRPMSALHAEDRARRGPGLPLSVTWIDRDPDELAARISLRLDRMMARGYLHEVRALLDAGYHRGLRPMRSLGYQHLAAHIHGEIDLDEALRLTARDTRRLARKQRTWARGLGFVSTDRAGVLAAAEAAFGPPASPLERRVKEL